MPQNASATPALPGPEKRGIIVGLFPDLLSVGGVQLAGRHTAAALAAIAEKHHLGNRFLSLNDSNGEHPLRVSSTCFSAHGFQRDKLRFALAALFLTHRKPSLVVVAHPNLAPIALAMRWLAPELHVAVMTHGIEVWSQLSWLRRNALRQSDLILAPSTFTARQLRAVQGVAANKIRWLPWALDPDIQALTMSPKQLPLPVGFPSGRSVLSVGRWAANERYKGLEDLIRVMPQLIESVPNLHLVAIGDGSDRSRLEGIAKELSISHRVHFLRGLTKEELAACYAHCDVFALPSSGEGFGFVLLEAMAFGKAVVGGAHGGIPDLIDDAATGLLIQQGNKEELSGALRTLLFDDRLRSELGQAARERAQSKFRFEGFAASLEKALEPLVAVPMEPRVENSQKNQPNLAWQILFVVWLVVINVLYYAQYSAQFLSRFGAWFHRWR